PGPAATCATGPTWSRRRGSCRRRIRPVPAHPRLPAPRVTGRLRAGEAGPASRTSRRRPGRTPSGRRGSRQARPAARRSRTGGLPTSQSPRAISSGDRPACYTGNVSDTGTDPQLPQPRDQDPPPGPAEPVEPPAPGHGLAYALVAVFLAALAFGAWGAWVTFGPHPANARATIRSQQARIASLEQAVATLSRSDQISRDANRDLQ